MKNIIFMVVISLGFATSAYPQADLSRQEELARAERATHPELREGQNSEHEPIHSLSDRSVVEIVRQLLPLDNSYVILTDRFNYPHLANFGKVIVAESNRLEETLRVLNLPEVQQARHVITVAAGPIVDLAKAVSVEGKQLSVVPTLPSSSYDSSDQTTIGHGIHSLPYRAKAPDRVIFSVPHFLSLSEKQRAHWMSVGLTEYLSVITATADRYLRMHDGSIEDSLLSQDPLANPSFEFLDWAVEAESLNDVAALQKAQIEYHRIGLKDIELGTSTYRMGGETSFYHALLEIYPELVKSAPRGHILAWGSLLSAFAVGHFTSDFELFSKLVRVYSKLDVPLSLEEIGGVGITRAHIEKTLEALPQMPFRQSYLNLFIQEQGVSELVALLEAGPPSVCQMLLDSSNERPRIRTGGTH